MATFHLTPEQIRDQLDYSPITGKLTRRNLRGGRKPRHGDIGCLHDGYIRIWIGGKQVTAHKLAWVHYYGELPAGPIDHINGIRSDNRIENLRVASTNINAQNIRTHRSDSITGTLGVARTRTGKFAAHIRVELAGQRIQLYLGSYEDADVAHAVYLDAKRKLHPGCTI